MLRLRRFVADALTFARERRARLPFVLALLGAALLSAGVVLPWFRVPVAASGHLAAAVDVAGRDAPIALVFKALCASALGATVFLTLRTVEPKAHVARLAAILLAVLLFFPHACMVWCPNTAARATWLDAQHRSLVWTGGDVWSSGENKSFEWKSRLYVADILDEAGIMGTPALSPRAIPFGSVRDLLIWFGYSNSFCLFVCSGWVFSVIGAVLLLLSLFRSARGPDFATMWVAGRSGGLFLCVALPIALVPAVTCAWQVDRARVAAEHGELALSLARLESAASIVPMIRMNSDVVDEIGLLHARLGRQTPEAALHRARSLVQRGRLEEADALLSSMATAEDISPLVRLESIRALLRRGIREWNSGQAVAAAGTLEGVLEADPCNVKANYALELAYLRTGRFASVESLAARMRAIYRFFNTLDKVPVLGAVQENVVYAAYLAGDAEAAQAAREYLSDPSRLSKEQ
jgi:hypothetical protein